MKKLVVFIVILMLVMAGCSPAAPVEPDGDIDIIETPDGNGTANGDESPNGTPNGDGTTNGEPTIEPTPEPTPEPVYYKVRVNTLNYRSEPSMDEDAVLGQLGYETRLQYLGEDGEFTRVRLEDGQEVYCFSEYIVPEDVMLYAYLEPETAQKVDIKTGELVFEKDGVTPVMVKNELVDMRLYLPDAQYEQLFGTERNITGAPLYPRLVPLLQKDTLKKVMKAYDIFKADGYTLKIYDAYRPVRVQRILYDVVQNHHWIANPDTTASNHNRGCALDIALIDDATGLELEFPTPMHTFAEESARTCETWSSTAAANVEYMTEVMVDCGFNFIKSEWWHFSDTDSKKFMTTDIDLGSLNMLPKQEETK